jgi:hypothetical protein
VSTALIYVLVLFFHGLKPWVTILCELTALDWEYGELYSHGLKEIVTICCELSALGWEDRELDRHGIKAHCFYLIRVYGSRLGVF